MKSILLIIFGCLFTCFARAQSGGFSFPLQKVPQIGEKKKNQFGANKKPFDSFRPIPNLILTQPKSLPNLSKNDDDEVYTSTIDQMKILIPKTNGYNMPNAIIQEKEIINDQKRRIIPEITIPRQLPNYPIPLGQFYAVPNGK